MVNARGKTPALFQEVKEYIYVIHNVMMLEVVVGMFQTIICEHLGYVFKLVETCQGDLFSGIAYYMYKG